MKLNLNPKPSLSRSPEFDPAVLRAHAESASALLKSLGNTDRLLLLCQLVQGEMCVSDLEAAVGVGQPSLSQQLGVLRESGLVSARREGKHMYYSITSPSAVAVMQVLYQEFCAPVKKSKVIKGVVS